MGSTAEIGVLLTAVLVLAYAGADFARNRMRQRREGEMVERLAGEKTRRRRALNTAGWTDD